VPLLIVNRTPQAAAELGASVGAEWLSLAEFREQPRAVSALVLAAGGGTALLDATELARLRAVAPRALNGQLRTLDAHERAQLERLASTLAHRLAHLPLAGLRAAAVHASSDAVEAFFDGARSRDDLDAADREKT
jgi:glutamyl-tRNA reductase